MNKPVLCNIYDRHCLDCRLPFTTCAGTLWYCPRCVPRHASASRAYGDLQSNGDLQPEWRSGAAKRRHWKKAGMRPRVIAPSPPPAPARRWLVLVGALLATGAMLLPISGLLSVVLLLLAAGVWQMSKNNCGRGRG